MIFWCLQKATPPKDIKERGGEVGEVDVDIEVDGIKVKSGDFVFADNDTVIIIPREVMPIIKDNIIKAVKEESEVKDKIREGFPISEILKEHKSF